MRSQQHEERPISDTSGLLRVLFTIALLSLSVVVYIIPLPYKGEYIILSDVAWGVLIVAVLVSGVVSRNIPMSLPRRMRLPWRWFTLLVLMGTVVTLLYRTPGRSFFSLRLWGPAVFYTFRYILFLGAFAVAYEYFGDSLRATQGARILILAGGIVALIVVGQAMGIVPDFWPQKESEWVHVGPLSPHQGHLAFYMLVLASLVLLVRLSRRQILPGMLLNLVLVLSIAAELISGRRSGWVSMVVFFWLTGLLASKGLPSYRRLRLRGLMLAIGLLILILVFGNPKLRQAVEEVYDFERQVFVVGNNLEFRLIAPLTYLRYFFQSEYNPLLFNLLLGTGFASTRTYIVLVGGPYEKVLGGAHNQLVEIFFQLGIPGLLVYVWLMIEMFRSAIVRARRTGASGWVMVSSLVAINLWSLTGGLLGYSTIGGNGAIFFLVCFALGLRLLEQEQQESAHSVKRRELSRGAFDPDVMLSSWRPIKRFP